MYQNLIKRRGINRELQRAPSQSFVQHRGFGDRSKVIEYEGMTIYVSPKRCPHQCQPFIPFFDRMTDNEAEIRVGNL